MANTTVGSLIDTLRQLALLDPAQLAELERSQQRFADPKTLLQTLVKQGWLTRWQAKQLLNGRGADVVFGQYTLLDQLGEGGMGQVFKARQRNLNRLVALKVIRQDRLGNADALKRFQREIRAVSQLAHPNVVRAYDADQIGDRHIFVMEYADGADLSQVVEEQGPLPIPLACEYVRQAALGLQHAHERGLVHRDIKPSNLLLTKGSPQENKPGLVKLLDLGLSRLRESQNNETIDATMTRDGSVVGTPDYMAPEQARDSHTVDIRADIYSLGCTLYYLLAGTVPYPGGTGMEKVFKHQLEEPSPIERHRKDIPRALAAIVRKMMAKTVEQRYQTPAEVARVLEPLAPTASAAFQASLQPPAAPASRKSKAVHAASETPAQGLAARTRKDLASERPRNDNGSRRYRLLLVLALLLVGGGAGVAFWLWPAPSTIGGVTPTSRDSQPIATGPLVQGTLPEVPAGVEQVLGEPRFRHWGTSVCVAVSPDGKLASGGSDNVIRFWDAKTGQETAALRGHTSLIRTLAFSPDSRQLASGGMDNTVRLWDVESGRELACFKDHVKEINVVAFSPDGQTLASGGADRIVKLWEVTGRKSRAVLPHAGNVRSLSFSSDGKLLAAAAISGGQASSCELKVWDARSGTGSTSFQYANVAGAHVSFSPTKPILAVGLSPTLPGGPRGVIHLEHLGKRHEAPNLREASPIQGVAFLPDGETLAVALTDTLKLYTATTKPELRANLVGRAGGVITSLAVFPDGKTFLTGHIDCALRFWDNEKGLSPATPAGLVSPLRGLTISPDGKLAAAATELETQVRLWDLQAGKERGPQRGPDGGVQLLGFSGDSQRLQVAGVTGLLAWNAGNGQKLGAFSDDTWSSQFALSPDGKLAAQLNQPEGVRLYELPSCRLVQTLAGHTKAAIQAVFSPDSKTLATFGSEGTLRFWDVASKTTRTTINGVPPAVVTLAFSGDGALLTGALMPNGVQGPGELRVWNLAASKEVARSIEPGGMILGLLPSADGKTVYYWNKSGMKSWEPFTNQRWAPSEAGADKVSSFALSPDSQTLAVATPTRLLLWNLASRTLQSELPLPGPVPSLAFTPDGQRLVTANGNGTLYVLRCGRK